MKPMFAEIGSTNILNNKHYIFEPKMDGIRLILKKNKKVQLFNRLGKEVTSKYAHLNLGSILKAPATVDGELIVYDEKGNPDFSLMQHGMSDKSIIPTYVVFDVLEVSGKNVQAVPLLQRKELLEMLIKPSKKVQLMIYTADGKKLWKWIKKRKGEGVVAKQIDSPYVQSRSRLWLKVKTVQTIDAAIIGFSRKKKSFALGLRESGKNDNKNKWIHIGNVGSGLNDKEYRELAKELIPQPKNMELPPSIQQVKPQFVCEVEYLHVTKDKKLRTPVFLHLRADKKPEECTFEQL